MLWHLATNDEEFRSFESISKTELTAVYRLAKEFPEISFILAHSLFSTTAVHLWRQWEERDRMARV